MLRIGRLLLRYGISGLSVTTGLLLSLQLQPLTNETNFLNGKGISAEFLPHVFERFSQSGGGSRHGGLGLGLAIARQIVELHKGTIEAESPGEGLGSTFRVKLPVLAATKSRGQTQIELSKAKDRDVASDELAASER